MRRTYNGRCTACWRDLDYVSAADVGYDLDAAGPLRLVDSGHHDGSRVIVPDHLEVERDGPRVRRHVCPP